jgi:hypothetical protein
MSQTDKHTEAIRLLSKNLFKIRVAIWDYDKEFTANYSKLAETVNSWQNHISIEFYAENNHQIAKNASPKVSKDGSTGKFNIIVPSGVIPKVVCKRSFGFVNVFNLNF